MFRKHAGKAILVAAAIAAAGAAVGADDKGTGTVEYRGRRARNVIFFVGDGMGVSTVTATRVYSVGVAGDLVVD